MPSVDALRDAVLNELRALETLCNELEQALMQRDWARLEHAIAQSRRVMHAIDRAFDAAAGARDAGFDEQVFRRLRIVQKIRDDQMSRLHAYRDSVTERLELLGRARVALRSVGKRERPKSRLGSLDLLT